MLKQRAESPPRRSKMVDAPAMKSTRPGTLLGGRSRQAVNTTPSSCNIIDEDELANMRDFGERILDDIARPKRSPGTSRPTSDRLFHSDAANNYYHAMIASKLAVKVESDASNARGVDGRKGREDADSTQKSLEGIVAHALTVAKTPEDVARYLLLSSTSASRSGEASKALRTVPPVSSFENHNDNETTISAITNDVLSARSPGGPINATRVQSIACSVTTEVKPMVEELLIIEHDPPIESYPSPICSPEDDTPGYPETNARAELSPLPNKIRLPDDSMGVEKNKCNSNDDSTAASTNMSEDESNEGRNIVSKETVEPIMPRNSLGSSIMAAIRRTTSSDSRNSKSHGKASNSLGNNAYEMCEAIAKGDGKMNQSRRPVESDSISVAYSATDALSSTGVMSAPSIHSKKSVYPDTRGRSPIAKLKKTLSLSISKESHDGSKTREGPKVAGKESRGKSSQQPSKSPQLPPRVPVREKRVGKPAHIEPPSSLANMTGTSRRAESPACSVECSLKSKDGSVESKVLDAVAKVESEVDQSEAVEATSIDADNDKSMSGPKSDIGSSTLQTRVDAPVNEQGYGLEESDSKPRKEEKPKTATLKGRKDKLKRILTYRKKTNSSPTFQAMNSEKTELVNKSTFEIESKSATESNDDGSKRDTVASLPGQNAENPHKSSAPLGSIEIASRHPSIDAVSLPRELKHSKVQIWNEPANIDSNNDERDIRGGEGNRIGQNFEGVKRFAW